MLWGGLKPITRQLLLDGIVCSASIGSVWLPGQQSLMLLLSIFAVVVAFCGLTKRWPVTFLLVPLLGLHLLRYHFDASMNDSIYARLAFQGLHTIVCLAMALLAILFPAVELPNVAGPFAVGTIDTYFPTTIQKADGVISESRKIPCRIYYPISNGAILQRYKEYLNPQIAHAFARHSMAQAGPPLLKKFDWMLHHWMLPKVPVYEHTNTTDIQPSPLVIYSHGLGGMYDIYSYQCRNLASFGSVVVSLTHLDGSAAAVPDESGGVILHDYSVDYHTMDDAAYVSKRRQQADIRVQEAAQVAEYVLSHSDQYSQLFRLEKTDKCFFMGHSFGATTVLSVAARHLNIVQGIIAHEPAVDWMPNDARRRFFHGTDYSGGTGGCGEPTSLDTSLHDDTHILVLHSGEWAKTTWARVDTIRDMERKHPSKHFVIADSCHMEFSDTCMMTPVWLARAVGMTGQRNPCDTASEIGQVTLDFLQAVRKLQ